MITTVRTATRADAGHLVDWNAAMALETEDKVLDRAVLARGVAGVFDDPRRGFYLVAERDASAVGSLLVTFEWSDWRCGDWWWIQSVYVPPPARRLGVFRALYDDVERRARATPGVVGLRLYVEAGNKKAQQTYENLGMSTSSYRFFARGFLDET